MFGRFTITNDYISCLNRNCSADKYEDGGSRKVLDQCSLNKHGSYSFLGFLLSTCQCFLMITSSLLKGDIDLSPH